MKKQDTIPQITSSMALRDDFHKNSQGAAQSTWIFSPQINVLLKVYLMTIWMFAIWHATISLPLVIVIHRLLHTDFHMLSSCLRSMKQ